MNGIDSKTSVSLTRSDVARFHLIPAHLAKMTRIGSIERIKDDPHAMHATLIVSRIKREVLLTVIAIRV